MSQEISIFNPGNDDNFSRALKYAKSISNTDIIPEQFRGKEGNVLIALDLAARARENPLVIMQNLQIIKGKPSFSSQYVNEKIREAGYKIRFEEGQDGTVEWQKKQIPNYFCRVVAEKNGEQFRGPLVDCKIAIASGWFDRSGSQWPITPEKMCLYRSISWWSKKWEPGIGLGFPTSEEAEDIPTVKSAPIADLNKQFSVEPEYADFDEAEEAEEAEQEEPDDDDNII
jgi:hypothetical protein